MRIGAGTCRCGFAQPVQGLWLCAGSPRALPDCHGKEGVAGSSPAGGLRNPCFGAVFLFRSGLEDPSYRLRAGSGRTWARGRLCAAICWTAERVVDQCQGKDEVHGPPDLCHGLTARDPRNVRRRPSRGTKPLHAWFRGWRVSPHGPRVARSWIVDAGGRGACRLAVRRARGLVIAGRAGGRGSRESRSSRPGQGEAGASARCRR
jgi:hypothetical protein